MDDAIIWGKSKCEHDFYLQTALQWIKEHGLTHNKERCLFNLLKITYFGMVYQKMVSQPMQLKFNPLKSLRSQET